MTRERPIRPRNPENGEFFAADCEGFCQRNAARTIWKQIKRQALDRLIQNGFLESQLPTPSQNINTLPRPSYFSPGFVWEFGGGQKGGPSLFALLLQRLEYLA